MDPEKLSDIGKQKNITIIKPWITVSIDEFS